MDRVLGWLFRQVEVTPDYHVGRCLAVKATACTACADVCPHEAITIRRRVEIDAVDCTGCGICVDACPSGALEARGEAPASSPVRCSMVEGNVPSVVCLARLGATDLLAAAGADGSLLLARGDCAACAIGDAGVPERVAANVREAEALASAVGHTVDVTLEERERLDFDRAAVRLSRRDLFRVSGGEARRVAAGALAPLERLAGEEDATEAELPQAWRERLRILAEAGLEPDALVPARLPRLEPGCILCPSCTRACPTDALKRTFDERGAVVLHLEPSRCIGCDACHEVCPVDVVRMDDRVTWGELSGERVTLAASGHAVPPPGGVAR